jgi:hypothetical protein
MTAMLTAIADRSLPMIIRMNKVIPPRIIGQ